MGIAQSTTITIMTTINAHTHTLLKKTKGEHKIMDFIRNEKNRSDYNPNKRHCLYGQDGDLIMLGLASHEPHFCLLREEVVFNQERKRAILLKGKEDRLKEEEDMRKYVAARKKEQGLVEEEEKESKTSEIVSASLSSYMNNSNFELLHMSILRDYISYEFETSDVLPKSPFRLEPTIDDFVFMTFFVGELLTNDQVIVFCFKNRYYMVCCSCKYVVVVVGK